MKVRFSKTQTFLKTKAKTLMSNKFCSWMPVR